MMMQKFYTLGYGGKMPQDFIKILQHYGIGTLIDVRLRPDKATFGTYKKAKTADKGIQKVLKELNVHYFSLVELGNIFMEDQNWLRKYPKLLENSGNLLLKRFFESILPKLQQPFCLFCAENDYLNCHRKFLAGFILSQKPELQVEHIVWSQYNNESLEVFCEKKD
jgi:uncharacterized protein (DUF488 family)